MQVVCGRFDDEEYKARRCPPDEFQKRYGQFGVHTIWRCKREAAAVCACLMHS